MKVYAIDIYNETVEDFFQEQFPDAKVDDIFITMDDGIKYEICGVDVEGYIPDQIQLYTVESN